MQIAQQLYEGVSIQRNQTVGLITYMRTDSTRISNTARNEAVSFIEEIWKRLCRYKKNHQTTIMLKMHTKRFVRLVLVGHQNLLRNTCQKISIVYIS